MSKKIIIVEDDDDILAMMQCILEDEGFDVIALNKAESIEKIIDLAPQLILLDERLPEKSGHEFCARIKAHHLTKDIPVILVSAVRDLASVAGECRADGYIQKPFDLEDLTNLVKDI
ncbi:two-component system response regulator [Mucilaginibacter sp.]|uniref:response regulator n=1 Tax=Mucilaginibacter sp. TaxID=1882438 RepID=UPI00374D8C56